MTTPFTFTQTPPADMRPITDKLTVSTNRGFIATIIADAVRNGKRVAVVGDLKVAQIFTTGVRTVEEITADRVRTKTKGGVRPTKGTSGKEMA